MNPGATTRPPQSMVSRPERPSTDSAILSPTASMLSPTTNTSATRSMFCDGSTTRPPRSNMDLVIRAPLPLRRARAAARLCRLGQLRPAAGEQIEHRHSHRDAVGHLIENYAEWAIGDVGVDLDAAVHWTRVKNEHLVRPTLQPLARHAEDAVVLAERRDVTRRHALELQAKDVERVGPLDCRLDAIEHRHAKLVDRVGQERTWSADADLGAHFREAPDIRASDARVQHVADDAYLEAGELAEVIAQREHVEQSLRRMLVRPVARVDHVRFDAFGEKLGRARRAVADDDHVDPHRLEVPRCVDERLALGHAGAGRGDIDGVGRQTLLGKLERDACARRCFEEQVDHRRAAERGDLLDRPLADLLEWFGRVENELDLLAAQWLEPEEILPKRQGHVAGSRSAMTAPFL